jgi:hypothetical protein
MMAGYTIMRSVLEAAISAPAAALALGLALGMLHALDADHLVTVAGFGSCRAAVAGRRGHSCVHGSGERDFHFTPRAIGHNLMLS